VYMGLSGEFLPVVDDVFAVVAVMAFGSFGLWFETPPLLLSNRKGRPSRLTDRTKGTRRA